MSFSCSADWIDYGKNKAFAMRICLLAFFNDQGTTRRYHPVCVTTCCYQEGQGASFEKKIIDVSLFVWHGCRAHTNYPTVTQYA